MGRLIHVFLLLLISCAGVYSQISFQENNGQMPAEVQYYANLRGGGLFIQEDALVYNFALPVSDSSFKLKAKPHSKQSPNSAVSYSVSFYKSGYTKAQGIDVLPGIKNYYFGDNPSNWGENVKSYRAVRLAYLYKNIDLQLYSNSFSLKSDFIVRPHARVSDILIEYNGADSVRILQDGSLAIYMPGNVCQEKAPYAYQINEETDSTVQIPCRYVMKNGKVGFALGAYNRADTLIIDPELIFSTYTGSLADNWGSTATYDDDGNAFTAGMVDDDGFSYPVEGGKLQFLHGGGHGNFRWDVGIMKVSADGTVPIYATYYGGNGSDCPHSMIANRKGELMFFGTTGSSDLPGAVNDFSGGSDMAVFDMIAFDDGVDMFVAKLDQFGRLMTTVYYGGSNNDGLNYSPGIELDDEFQGNDSLYNNYGDWARGEIGLDRHGNVYIGCSTFSNDMPNAINSGNINLSGIVAKFSSDLGLEWSRYVGGDEPDAIYSIDIDDDDNIYATGGTSSKNLPTDFNAYQRNYLGGSTDGFIAKLNANGGLSKLTYFGSAEYDQSYFVRADKNDNVYIYGQTHASGDELVYNAVYNIPNSGQFITKFNNDLSDIIWSTVFGTGNGKANISPTAFSVDLCNRVYLSGSGREWYWDPYSYTYVPSVGYYEPYIEGTNGMEVTGNAFRSTTDGQDFYIMVMYDDASALDYATFIGEEKQGHMYVTPTGYYVYGADVCGHDHVDGGTSRFDRQGNVYQSICASCSGCSGLEIAPNPGAVSVANNSDNCNNAVMKFNIHNDMLETKFKAYQNICDDKEVRLHNTTHIVGIPSDVEYTWNFGDGTTSNDSLPVHTYANYGTYTIELLVVDMSSCNLRDSDYVEIEILPLDEIVPDSMHICYGDTVLLGFDPFPDPDFTYTWTPTDYLMEIGVANPLAIVEDDIVYHLVAETDYCKKEYDQEIVVLGGALQVDVEVDGQGSTDVLCAGDELNLYAHANDSVASYEWSWSGGFEVKLNDDPLDSVLTISVGNNDTIFLRSISKHCQGIDIDTVIIKQAESLIIAAASADVVCEKEQVELSVFEIDNDSLVYSWEPSNLIFQGRNSDTALAIVDKPTLFRVTGTDTLGCKYQQNVFVDVDSMSLSSANLDFVSCFGLTDGAINLNPGGYSPYEINWSDGLVGRAVRDNLPAGNYSVSITDRYGCENEASFELIQPSLLTLNAKINPVTCEEVCNGIVSAIIAGGTPPYNLRINDSLVPSPITDLCPGQYSLSVEDENACRVYLPIDVFLEPDLPFLHAGAQPQIVVRGREAELSAAPENAVRDSVVYMWSPEESLLGNNSAVVVASPEETTLYTVVATDTWGCNNFDTVSVSVVDYICDEPYVFVPNAFSPNADGSNDRFKVYSEVLESFTISVYSRWGQLIWQTSDADDEWDGTFDGELLEPAVYDYYLEGTCFDKENIKLKGNINLIR